jgi:hypothetical protein
MSRFLFSLMLLRQRIDERIAVERSSPRSDPAALGSLQRRKQALKRKLTRTLGRELLAGA